MQTASSSIAAAESYSGEWEFNAGYQWSLQKKLFVGLVVVVIVPFVSIAPYLFWQGHEASKSLHSFGDALAAKTAAGVSTATTKSERVEVDWLLGTSERQ